jgi:hypothetical protein
VERPVEVVRDEVHEVRTEIHEARAESESGPVIRYETDSPADRAIEVTYENNALGDHHESRADKSDRTPD